MASVVVVALVAAAWPVSPPLTDTEEGTAVELHFATVWESIADAIPEQDAVIHGSTRLRWGEYDERAARLVSALTAAGLGPGSKVALYLYNSAAYAESHF